MKSIGLIEVSGVTAAIDCLDIMCKSADVQFVTWERKLGGRLVTVIITGNVSAVTAAIDRARQGVEDGLLLDTSVIAGPDARLWDSIL